MYAHGDGFDRYVNLTEAISALDPAGSWTTQSSLIVTSKTPFARGQCLQVNGTGTITKTGLVNGDTWFLSFWFMQTTALSGSTECALFAVRDGTTSQCTVMFRSDGAILVHSGAGAGTVIATFPSAFAANQYDFWQIKFIVHNTVGEVRIRKNGAATDTFVVTGVNTRGGTTNNYANAIVIGGNSSAATQYFDDFLCYDSRPGDNLNDWLPAPIRCINLSPSNDTAQKQFTIVDAASTTFGQSATSSLFPNLAANRVFTGMGFTAARGGAFTTATVEFNAAATGKVRLALYQLDGDRAGFNSSNKPGYLVAASNELINPVVGPNVFTFPAPVGVMSKRSYVFAVMSDVAVVLKSPATTGVFWFYNTPFSGGFPADLTNIAGQNSPSNLTAYAILNVTNAGSVSDDITDTASYTVASTVGNYDLYELEDLPYSPLAIYGVRVVSQVSKSDAGARGLKLVTKSNGAEFRSAEYAPTTSFLSASQYFAQDPGTSAAWTPETINALQIGLQVSS